MNSDHPSLCFKLVQWKDSSNITLGFNLSSCKTVASFLHLPDLGNSWHFVVVWSLLNGQRCREFARDEHGGETHLRQLIWPTNRNCCLTFWLIQRKTGLHHQLGKLYWPLLIECNMPAPPTSEISHMEGTTSSMKAAMCIVLCCVLVGRHVCIIALFI